MQTGDFSARFWQFSFVKEKVIQDLLGSNLPEIIFMFF